MGSTLLLSAMSRILISANVPPSFKSLAITQMSTAFVSFVASAAMAATIAWTGNGLSVPYRRIIFGLSICDIAQSLGLLLGPLSVPSDIPNCWGQGNSTTCRISAFLLTAGTIAVPIYTCFIAWYYLCKLKYRMSDENFTLKTETKIHTSIAIFVIGFTLMALVLDTFHTVPAKTLCSISTIPLGCRIYPGMEGCDTTITARVDTLFATIQFLRGACIAAMISMMSMIYWHAMKQINTFLPISWCCPRIVERRQNQRQSQEHVSYLASVYRNEIVVQTSCFVGAFCITYIPESTLYIVILSGGRPSRSQIYLSRILYPLGGLFNILVHCRPKASSLHRDHPDLWWFHCLWLVLKAGGELPEQQFSDESNNDGDHDGGDLQTRERPRYSFSSTNLY